MKHMATAALLVALAIARPAAAGPHFPACTPLPKGQPQPPECAGTPDQETARQLAELARRGIAAGELPRTGHQVGALASTGLALLLTGVTLEMTGRRYA